MQIHCAAAICQVPSSLLKRMLTTWIILPLALVIFLAVSPLLLLCTPCCRLQDPSTLKTKYLCSADIQKDCTEVPQHHIFS